MLKKLPVLILAIIIALTQAGFITASALSAPGAYDLIAEVNAYRVSNGYWELTPNAQVMSAAQGHADWIAAGNPGGHTGAAGSDETTRVYWSGYGGGATIQCDEAWASTRSVYDAVYIAWSDWTHQEVMLNGWGNKYTDIGAGVADLGNGAYVFVLDICMVKGEGYSGSSSLAIPGSTLDPNATPDLSNYIFGVLTATPGADGSIRHTVKYGQTLASIAQAYGITVPDLQAANDMAADQTIIREGQTLFIKQTSGTPQASAGTSATIAGTASTGIPQISKPVATRTLMPTLRLPTAESTPVPDEKTPEGSVESPPSQTVGVLLIILFGAGLIAFMYFAFLKK